MKELPKDSPAASKELRSYHPDGRQPLRDSDTGETFCAYSMDDPMPSCPFGHRIDTHTKEKVIDGQRRRLIRCHDSRLKTMPPMNYCLFCEGEEGSGEDGAKKS